MAPALGVRPVDDADEPLEPRHREALAEVTADLAFTQVEQEPVNPALVRHALMALGKRGSGAGDRHWPVPVVSGGDGPGMRSNPISRARESHFSFTSWPMFSSRRLIPMSV